MTVLAINIAILLVAVIGAAVVVTVAFFGGDETELQLRQRAVGLEEHIADLETALSRLEVSLDRRPKSLWVNEVPPDPEDDRFDVTETRELGGAVHYFRLCRHLPESRIPVISAAGEHVSDICRDCDATLYVPEGAQEVRPEGAAQEVVVATASATPTSRAARRAHHLALRTPTFDHVRH